MSEKFAQSKETPSSSDSSNGNDTARTNKLDSSNGNDTARTGTKAHEKSPFSQPPMRENVSAGTMIPDTNDINDINDTSQVSKVSKVTGIIVPARASEEIVGNGIFELVLVELFNSKSEKSFQEISDKINRAKDLVKLSMTRKKEFFKEVRKESQTKFWALSEKGITYVNGKIKLHNDLKSFEKNKLSLEEERLKKKEYLLSETRQIYQNVPYERVANSLYFNFMDIAEFNPAFSMKMIEEPELIFEAFSVILDSLELDFRLRDLPDSSIVPIENIRTQHLNTLVAIEGRSVSMSSVRPQVVSVRFECPNCGAILSVHQNEKKIREPKRCSCGWRGNFKTLSKEMVNAARIIIEDLQEKTDNPHTQRIDAFVSNDLTKEENIKIFTPGNEVKCVGILREVPVPLKGGGISTRFDQVLEIISASLSEEEINIINFTDEQILEIKELASRVDESGLSELTSSFAPDVFGYETEKEALILQLCNSRNNRKTSKVRNKPNILLIGDPGVAKTVLGDFVIAVTPGSRKAVGGGSSAVGLTASVVKEDESMGGYRVEPGALVLAKDTLFIDELNNLTDDDKPKLQEGMSEQCYDGKTEILTDKGWMFFTDLDKTEKVATLSKDGKLEFEKPTNWIKYSYKGRMIHFASNKCDLLVTPKHKMFVSRKLVQSRKGWNDFKLVEAENIKDKCFRVKRDAVWEGEEKDYFVAPPIIKFKNQNCKGSITNIIKFKMDDWLEFLGYYISEGSISYIKGVPYNVFLTQSDSVNHKTREKMKNCLRKLNLKFNESGNNIYFCSKQIASYLSRLKTVKEKFVPSFVKEISKRQIKIIIEALLDGDGHRGKTSTSYVTSSKRLADDVQELLLRIGISGTISTRTKEKIDSYKSKFQGRRIKPTGDIHTVTFGNYNTPYLNHHKKWKQTKEVDYSGDVYCVDVRNHIVYVRRNGKPCWSGNSVTINKASLHVKLKVTAGILAVANPAQGHFIQGKSYVEQFNIPSPIINRFDTIYIIKDNANEERDKSIAQKMIDRERKKIDQKYNVDFLRRFFTYIKQTKEPKINDVISNKLKELYSQARKTRTLDLNINPRFMEALLRMIKASAKVRLSDMIEEKDIERAMNVISKSHYQISQYKYFNLEGEKGEKVVGNPLTYCGENFDDEKVGERFICGQMWKGDGIKMCPTCSEKNPKMKNEHL